MIVVNAFIKKSVYRNGCTASWHRRSRGGDQRVHAPHQSFRKYSHFVVCEAFFWTKI